MSNEQNRRDFIGRSFRLGGLFAAFGSWNTWSAFNHFSHESKDNSAPVPSRLLASEPNEVIDHFIRARGAASIYYCQMFFPTFLAGNEVQNVIALAELSEKQMGLVDQINRSRLRVVPAVAAAHMLPLANETDAHMLRDVFLKAHKASFSDDPCRMALGYIWTCMTAAVIRNRSNWGKMMAGADIVKAAEEVCLKFLCDDDSTLPLIHTSASAWQFLMTYQKALIQRGRLAVDELRSVEAAINQIRRKQGLHYSWLDKIDKLYEGLNNYDEMPPEYFELILGRCQTKPGSPERKVADFFVLLRLYTMYLNHLGAEDKLKSPYLSGAEVARDMNKRSFAFLADYGVSPNDWKTLRLSVGSLIPRDGIKYLDSIFQNYDTTAKEAGAGGIEAHYAEWYSKHVPFNKLLPEELAAADAYDSEGAVNSALESLRQSKDVESRLAFCLPAIIQGCNWEMNSTVADKRRCASVEEAKQASLSVLATSRYATAFKLLSERTENFPKAEVVQISKPAGFSLAGAGGDMPLRGKETMNESSSENENRSQKGKAVEQASTSPASVPLKLQWKSRLGFYRQKKALCFSTDEEFAKMLKLFWEDDTLYGLPRNHAGQRIIVVPAEAVACIRDKGFTHFREIDVVSSGSLPPEKEARFRREQGMK
jgi:hypothetical protein